MATTTTSFFPYFPKLPAELRDIIWREALPDEPAPALFFFKTGCWLPRGTAEPDLTLEFQHDRLDPVEFEVALAFVNHEARGIAIAWIRERGFAMQLREDRDPVGVRRFDPTIDALYVGINQWDDFHQDAYNRMAEPDLLDRAMDIVSSVRRIAMPEALVKSKMAVIPVFASDFLQVTELLVVVNPPTEAQLANDKENEALLHWTFTPTQGDAFFWNLSRNCFELGDGVQRAGEGLVSRLVETSAEAIQQMAQQGWVDVVPRRFKVSPVVATSTEKREGHVQEAD